MFCPKCGARLTAPGAFCSSCGSRVAATTLSAPAMTRPTAVTVLAVLQFIGGALWGLVGAGLAFVNSAGPQNSQADPGTQVAAALLIGVAAFQITCGLGLWRLRSYGRIMQMIAAGIGLLGIPIGTVISILILVYLSKPGIKVLFSGKQPEELTPDEIAAVQVVASGGAGVIIIVIAVALVAIFVVGIIAAIAVPGLLRARMAGNEAVAIGALRAISSGEAAYAVANGGYYDSQECLVTPSNCLSGFRDTPFLAEEYRAKSGYHFELAGTPAPDLRDRKTSRTSLSSFVAMATPLSPSTGTRMFCLDDSGVIRWRRAQGAVPPATAACPSSWAVVE
jgi:type II secretory pathway pseudopilin PulG